jgi:hypothetical protein
MLFYFSNDLVVASAGESTDERCALQHVTVARAGVVLPLVPTRGPGVAWFSAGNSFFSNKVAILTSIHLHLQYEP